MSPSQSPHQLTLADLRQRFHVTECRWLVFSHKGQLKAHADTRNNRKRLADRGIEVLRRVSGVPRNVAVKVTRLNVPEQ